jgi:predicted phage-related endonuclease
VWAEKCGHAPPRDLDDNESVQWGTLLEPIIREEACRRVGLTVELPGTLQSIEHPHMLYNPDGILSDGSLLEIKTTSAFLAHEWDADLGIAPDVAELQVVHGMAVTGAHGAWVVGLIGGQRLEMVWVPRDEELVATVIDAEQAFWDNHIVADVAPPIDGSDATTAALAARWPRRTGVELVVDDPVAVGAAAWDYLTALKAEKTALEAKATAVNKLTDMLAGADALTDCDGRRLVAIKRGQFREKAFRDEEPDADLWLKKVDVVDRDELKTKQPDLYRRYQATSIYIPKQPTSKDK